MLYLDLDNRCLWRDTTKIDLTPTTFVMLQYMVRHPNRLLCRKELLENVWPHNYVTRDLIKSYIRDLRRLLGDDPKNPRFIETVRGSGYRYIGNIRIGSLAVSVSSSKTILAGRHDELQLLNSSLQRALSGKQQKVFVSGEQGIGKTHLLRYFLGQLKALEQRPFIAHGRSLESYNQNIPYLTLLEALDMLFYDYDSEWVIACFKRHAPYWLQQLSQLSNTRTQSVGSGLSFDETQQNMLLELAHVLEAIALERPLVLCLGDLQWSDETTLIILNYLAQRQLPTKLLIIGTHRPEQALPSDHQLRVLLDRLQQSEFYQHLRLKPLDESAVVDYLEQRFPGLPVDRLAYPLLCYSGGNPLFLKQIVDHLLDRKVISYSVDNWLLNASVKEVRLKELIEDIPDSLLTTVEQQQNKLDENQRQLLEAASVVGDTFQTFVLAIALEKTVETVERDCEELAKRSCFIRAKAVSRGKDGRVSCYEFRHPCCREIFYQSIPSFRRRQLQKIASGSR